MQSLTLKCLRLWSLYCQVIDILLHMIIEISFSLFYPFSSSSFSSPSPVNHYLLPFLLPPPPLLLLLLLFLLLFSSSPLLLLLLLFLFFFFFSASLFMFLFFFSSSSFLCPLCFSPPPSSWSISQMGGVLVQWLLLILRSRSEVPIWCLLHADQCQGCCYTNGDGDWCQLHWTKTQWPYPMSGYWLPCLLGCRWLVRGKLTNANLTNENWLM